VHSPFIDVYPPACALRRSPVPPAGTPLDVIHSRPGRRSVTILGTASVTLNVSLAYIYVYPEIYSMADDVHLPSFVFLRAPLLAHFSDD
jgi:hypothetical protein